MRSSLRKAVREMALPVIDVVSVEIGASLRTTDVSGRRWARQQATSLRAGQSILLKGKLFSVLKATHHQGTARQVGNVHLELRDIRTQLRYTERLRSSAEVEMAFLTATKHSILYTEDKTVVCMDTATYDQVNL